MSEVQNIDDLVNGINEEVNEKILDYKENEKQGIDDEFNTMGKANLKEKGINRAILNYFNNKVDNDDNFFEYVVINNKDDRDIGEIRDISDEEKVRLYNEYFKKEDNKQFTKKDIKEYIDDDYNYIGGDDEPYRNDVTSNQTTDGYDTATSKKYQSPAYQNYFNWYFESVNEIFENLLDRIDFDNFDIDNYNSDIDKLSIPNDFKEKIENLGDDDIGKFVLIKKVMELAGVTNFSSNLKTRLHKVIKGTSKNIFY